MFISRKSDYGIDLNLFQYFPPPKNLFKKSVMRAVIVIF